MDNIEFAAILDIAREAKQQRTTRAGNKRFIANCKTIGLTEAQTIQLGILIECWTSRTESLEGHNG